MERGMRPYKALGNFKIEPYDMRFFALYDGEALVCVTVYKAGALEVMQRLFNLQEVQNGKN